MSQSQNPSLTLRADVRSLVLDMVAHVDRLEAKIARQEQRIGSLEAALAGRGPRHEADALLTQMATSTEGRTFTASDLLRHAGVDDALQAALERIEGASELGASLSDRKGQRGDLVVERQGRHWRVTTHRAHEMAPATGPGQILIVACCQIG